MIGLLLPAGTDWPTALKWARQAEEAGWAHLWLEDGRAPVALAAGLFRRLRIRLGLVLNAERRAPTVLAKELTSLDVVSGGRLDVGTGRTPAGEEMLSVVAAMSGGEPFDWSGTIGSAAGARCLPPSAQHPHPPLWYAEATAAPPPAGAGSGGPAAPAGWGDAGLGFVRLEPR